MDLRALGVGIALWLLTSAFDCCFLGLWSSSVAL